MGPIFREFGQNMRNLNPLHAVNWVNWGTKHENIIKNILGTAIANYRCHEHYRLYLFKIVAILDICFS